MTGSSDESDVRVATYLERTGLAARGVSTSDLAGDASDRRYVRIRHPDGATQVLLVHKTPIDAATLPFLNVAELFSRLSIPIPRVRDVAEELGILLLDDLGDVTLHRFLRTATDSERRNVYRQAVALVVRMQREGQDAASTAFLPFTLAFDAEKLCSELSFFVTHYLGSYLQVRLDDENRIALDEEFRVLGTRLAGEDRVLCHRDYHSRNLMVKDGTLHVIDFQDARLGPNTYDLVSLLRDCYVSLPLPLVDELMAYYHEESARTTTGADEREYFERFDRMSVQRHLKALGTFGYQAGVVGKTGYLDAVPRTLAYLGEVFARRKEFGRLRQLLAPHIPELT